MRQKEGLSYGISSQFQASSLDRTRRLARSYAIYAPQNAAHLIADFREEIARVLKDGVTEQELATAKAGYLQRRAQSRANDNELASILVARRDVGRTMKFDAQLDAALNAATVQQVNDALRKYITPADFTSVKAGDFAKAAAAAPVKPAP